MLNKNIPNNGVKEAGTSGEGPSPSSLRMQGQGLVSFNQVTLNETSLNAGNEDNVIEWEDLFGNSMEITNFNGSSCESSNEEETVINYNNKERQTWSKTLNMLLNVIGMLFFD